MGTSMGSIVLVYIYQEISYVKNFIFKLCYKFNFHITNSVLGLYKGALSWVVYDYHPPIYQYTLENIMDPFC